MKGIEVAETAEEDESQSKLWITCVTCGITKAFYTPHGVRYFELTHVNHQVQKGKPKTEADDDEKEELRPAPKEQEMAVEAPSAELISDDDDDDEKDDEAEVELPTVRLEKLVVSLATSGSEKKQILRVRGVGPEEKDFFVLNFVAERAPEVRVLIEGGEYVQDEIPPMGRYTWTPQLLEVSDAAGSLLGFHMPKKKEEVEKVEAVKEMVAVPEPVEVKKPEVKAQPEVKPQAVPVIQRRETKKEVPLLLAKSSYIQQNEENMNEARRVSKVLMEFRWNIEPPYGINVLFDDNISIQSNTGVISTNVIKKIEEIGYTFVAFEASHGAPTAWFKRKRKESDGQLSLFPDLGEVILPIHPLGGGNGFSNLVGEPAQESLSSS